MATDSFENVPRFPEECPQCMAIAGAPYEADTILHASRIIVGMRCAACAHEWRIEVPTLLTSHGDRSRGNSPLAEEFADR